MQQTEMTITSTPTKVEELAALAQEIFGLADEEAQKVARLAALYEECPRLREEWETANDARTGFLPRRPRQRKR